MLGVIFFTQQKNFLPVVIITSIHFIADIFIMMMFSAYSHSNYSQGTYYQIISLLLFLSLKIYTGLVGDGWHYLIADPIYILAAIKNYQIDVKKTDLRIINTVSMTFLSLLILLIVFIQTKRSTELNLINSSPKLVQTIGIFLFAIALSTTANEKLRYEISLIALLTMVCGSLWETVSSWNNGKVVGLAISYTLLPLTVLIFYLKRWPMIMKNKKIASVTSVPS